MVFFSLLVRFGSSALLAECCQGLQKFLPYVSVLSFDSSSFLPPFSRTRRYCVNAASLTFKPGQGEDQGPSRGIAAGLMHSISKRFRRKSKADEDISAPSPPTTAAWFVVGGSVILPWQLFSPCHALGWLSPPLIFSGEVCDARLGAVWVSTRAMACIFG